MVIAYHLIWTVYGTWLPNDLRGSGSRNVGSRKLATMGAAHLGRKKIQPRRDDVHTFYEQAEPELKHDVIRLDGDRVASVADTLGAAIRATPYTCYACTIMPDHVHLVIRRHRHTAEEMIGRIQEATRCELDRATLVPEWHPVWTTGGWRVFLDSAQSVRLRVRYVEGNPEKAGLARQCWPFVAEYDGWPYGGRGLNRKR